MGERVAKKVLLIGWDGADWRWMRPLMDRGVMPNLQRLVTHGASGNLSARPPLICPMLWTSIVTGKRAHRHGIHGFVEPRPDRNGVRAPSSASRTGKAVWNILSQADLRSCCVNWPASHPAEPINGAVVSDRFAVLPSAPARPWPALDDAVHPQRLAQALSSFRIRPEEIEPSVLLSFVPRARETDQETDKRLVSLAMLLARATTVHAAATWMIEHEPWDFAAILYDGIELACRQFSPSDSPAATGSRGTDPFADVVAATYAFCDMMLGRLLELAGLEVTTVLVSDHGFGARAVQAGPANDPAAIAASHRRQGIWVMQGPAVRAGAEVVGASIFDVTPTILTLFGLPRGADMDGRPWVESIDSGPAKLETDSVITWEQRDDGSGTRASLGGDASREAIEHLLELGYTDPSDDPGPRLADRTEEDNQHNLARALLDAGQPLEAAKLLEPLAARRPAHLGLAETLFNALLATGRLEEARRLAFMVLDRGVNPALANLALGAVELAERRPASAIGHFAQARQLDPGIRGLPLLVAQGYLRLRRWDDADREFRAVVATDPDNESAWHGMSTIALAKGRPDEAVELALRAIGLRPDYPEAHYHLGVALIDLGRPDDAATALKRCLALRPGMLPAYRRLIELSEGALNDPDAARGYRRLARELMLQRRLTRRPLTPDWPARRSGSGEPRSP